MAGYETDRLTMSRRSPTGAPDTGPRPAVFAEPMGLALEAGIVTPGLRLERLPASRRA